MRYVCKAKIIKEDFGYSAFFPQIEGAITQGDSLYEVLTNAETALSEILAAYEDYQDGRIKEMANEICLDKVIVGDDTFIKADTDEYRENPSEEIALWFNPKNKKYFTVLTDDEVEVKPTVEKYLAEIAGVA